jgi:hypothetical protein
MNRSERLLTTASAILLLIFLTAAAAAGLDKIPRDVIDHAAANGTVLVLVGLDVPWQKEATLDQDGVRAQRVAIASIQDDLLKDLFGKQYRITRRYQEVPGIGLEVGADALAELARLPLVTNVLLDRAISKPAEEHSAAQGQVTVSGVSVAEKVPATLFARAASNGSVLVLAGLRTAWQREDYLSEELLELQRTGIHDAQSYLLHELSGTTYKVTRIYRRIPGIALRVGTDALKVLEKSPAVTNVVEDRPPQAAR